MECLIHNSFIVRIKVQDFESVAFLLILRPQHEWTRRSRPVLHFVSRQHPIENAGRPVSWNGTAALANLSIRVAC